ncbi:nucleotidyltransferase domain-containing protein [Candidatus Palauibacter sp.]|uniref:nucleotidyltransferase domain-containing protein n=1 Tax=Candidatus Palauibacter sp. TaxID=3101350 RepID=UPI003B023ED0
MTDGLKDAHREAIIAVIEVNERVERAVLFGSRATGTNTVSSDVDIALFGDRLTLTDQARLAAALDDIPMAQSVDLVLHNSIQDPTLREHIRRQGIEWYERPTHMARRARYLDELRLSGRLDTDKSWSGVHQDRQRSYAARRQRCLPTERTVRIDPEPKRIQSRFLSRWPRLHR